MSDNEKDLQQDLIDSEADKLFGALDEDETEDQNDSEVSEEQSETPVSKTETTVAENAPVEVEKAKKHGYLTKEEYIAKHGSEEGFKSPEQFNKYGEAWSEVSDVIKNMKKQLDERNKQIDALVQYNERVEERAANKARQQLEQQILEAKQLGDVEAVENLTKEKAKQEFQSYQTIAQQAEQERIQAQQTFIENNKHWFNINPIMTDRAKQIDMEERNKATSLGITIGYKQLADLVEARLRLEFPSVMISRNTGDTAPVITSTQSAVNKSVGTISNSVDKVFHSLSQEHRTVFEATNRSLKRQGRKEYSKQEYIEQLKKYGDL